MTNDYLLKFITEYQVEPNRLSSLKQAIKDARFLTNRDPGSGAPDYSLLEKDKSIFNPYSFIGLINYYLVLDIIGAVFCLHSSNYNNENPIEIALKDFSNLNSNEVSAIKALRNSLTHSYSLVNIPDNPLKNNFERHAFSIINLDDAPLLKFPSESWNGEYDSDSANYNTEIGYLALIELFEEVIRSLEIKFKNDEVMFRLKNGINELNKKYTVRV